MLRRLNYFEFRYWTLIIGKITPDVIFYFIFLYVSIDEFRKINKMKLLVKIKIGVSIEEKGII